MSNFDPETFLGQAQQAETFSTRRTPLDEGEYIGQITDVKVRDVKFRDGREGKGIDLFVAIEGPEVESQTGLPKVTPRMSFLLDLTDAGNIDSGKGKNLRLGRVLEACGLNGKAWSFNDLKGNVVKVKLKHRPDDNDPEVVYEEITAMTKA